MLNELMTDGLQY